jgi:nitrogen fixation protein NifZ
VIPVRIPKYQWGQRVRAVADLADDGSHPGAVLGAALVESGTVGEIVRVGRHEESDTPVYLVEFGGALLVGCREEELDVA